MALDVVRFALLLLNVPYLLAGGGLLLLAEAGRKEFGELGTLVLKTPINFSYVITGVGGLLFITALFGFCGALRQSRFELKMFAFMMTGALLLEVAIIIYGVMNRDKLEDTKLKLTLRETMKQYNTSALMNSAWDELQPAFNCCGVENYTDWGAEVPKSCCKKVFEKTCPKEFLYEDGCWKKLKDAWTSRTKLILIIGIVSLVLQVVGVILAWMLKVSIEAGQEPQQQVVIVQPQQATEEVKMKEDQMPQQTE